MQLYICISKIYCTCSSEWRKTIREVRVGRAQEDDIWWQCVGPLPKLRTPCMAKAEEGDSLNYGGIEQKGKKKPQGQSHQFLCGIQVWWTMHSFIDLHLLSFCTPHSLLLHRLDHALFLFLFKIQSLFFSSTILSDSCFVLHSLFLFSAQSP